MNNSEVNPGMIGRVFGFTPLLGCLGEYGLEAQIWILLKGLLLTFLWNTSVFFFSSPLYRYIVTTYNLKY